MKRATGRLTYGGVTVEVTEKHVLIIEEKPEKGLSKRARTEKFNGAANKFNELFNTIDKAFIELVGAVK